MVTGQSVVLYSRLHLVVRKAKILKGILAMIIVNGICLHGPTIVITIGTNSRYDTPSWSHGMAVIERIQLIVFALQESFISIVYIISTLRLLKSTYHSATRSIMRLLITVNAICLSFDIILIALEYSNNHAAQTSVKAFLYAAKLKLEFYVLNQLMNIASKGLTEGNRWAAGGEVANPYNAIEPTHERNYFDPDDYRNENITGWPRGRLFGDRVNGVLDRIGRRPRGRAESTTSLSMPSDAKGKKREAFVEPRWDEGGSVGGAAAVNKTLPNPPAFSNHPSTRSTSAHLPHLPSVDEEIKEEVLWGARGFPSAGAGVKNVN